MNINFQESSISSEDQANISLQKSQELVSQLEDEQGEPFKGSFLLQMERLTKPLQFEPFSYSIYSQQYHYGDNDLLFLIEETDQQNIQVNFSQYKECDQYILDFTYINKCPCNCHTDRSSNHKSSKSNSMSKKCATLKSENQNKNEKKLPRKAQSGKRIFEVQDKKWAPCSLKQYKQKIKLKLQEKL